METTKKEAQECRENRSAETLQVKKAMEDRKASLKDRVVDRQPSDQGARYDDMELERPSRRLTSRGKRTRVQVPFLDSRS